MCFSIISQNGKKKRGGGCSQQGIFSRDAFAVSLLNKIRGNKCIFLQHDFWINCQNGEITVFLHHQRRVHSTANQAFKWMLPPAVFFTVRQADGPGISAPCFFFPDRCREDCIFSTVIIKDAVRKMWDDNPEFRFCKDSSETIFVVEEPIQSNHLGSFFCGGGGLSFYLQLLLSITV